MASGYQNIIGIFTVSASQAASALLSGSDFDPYDKFTLYASGNLAGPTTIQIQPDTGSLWYTYKLQTGGSTGSVNVLPGDALTVYTPAAANFRISGSIQAAGSSSQVIAYGQYLTDVKILPQ